MYVLENEQQTLLLSGSARDGTVDLEIQSPTLTPEPPPMIDPAAAVDEQEVEEIKEEPSNVDLLLTELEKVDVNGETTLTSDSQADEEQIGVDEDLLDTTDPTRVIKTRIVLMHYDDKRILLGNNDSIMSAAPLKGK